jgi:hypothetical protein
LALCFPSSSADDEDDDEDADEDDDEAPALTWRPPDSSRPIPAGLYLAKPDNLFDDNDDDDDDDDNPVANPPIYRH